MRKFITSIFMLLVIVGYTNAQFTFTDNFDGYTATALGPQSSTWTTWSGTEGGTEDVVVTTANAFSAPNSIYFSSTASGGGPQDVVLPFGSQFTKGSYHLSFRMFVNTGKTAYFNIQQNVAIGAVWNSDFNFLADGNLAITNANSGELLRVPYPQNAWFEFELNANLNNSEWRLMINGTTVGIYHNTSLGIASIDIYPVLNSQFYIDDIDVSHTPAPAFTNNICVNYVDVKGGKVAGQQVTVKALLRNVGTTTIASPEVSLYNNGTLIQSTTFIGLNLVANDTQIVSFTTPFMAVGTNVIAVDAQPTAASNVDDDTDDDTLVYNLTSLVPADGKIVVGEEGTGTWCGWCPRGAVFMDRFSKDYEGYFAGIAVHNGDPMTIPEYDSGIGLLISGYPSALVDRGNDVDPSAMENDIRTRLLIAPKAVITNGATYNSSTGILNVSLTTTFTQAVASGNYKLVCVLTQDSVKGTASGYNQNNYYAGGSNGVMGGFESLPSSVPASTMRYDHVARFISPSFTGIPNAFTLPASIGFAQTYNFTFTIPSTYNIDKMHIIGMFVDPSGIVDNASYSTIDQAITNGFVNGTQVAGVEDLTPLDYTNLYPNPANSLVNLSLDLPKAQDVKIKIYDLSGKVILDQIMNVPAGNSVYTLSTEAYSAGMYIIDLSYNDVQKSMKFSVIK